MDLAFPLATRDSIARQVGVGSSVRDLLMMYWGVCVSIVTCFQLRGLGEG